MTWKCRLAVAVPLALVALDANAQSWPSRPIEMIIPFPAGGGVDVIGRAVATAMSAQLGQQVVVNNRDGAAGTIGFNALACGRRLMATRSAFGPTTPIANAPYLVKGCATTSIRSTTSAKSSRTFSPSWWRRSRSSNPCRS